MNYSRNFVRLPLLCTRHRVFCAPRRRHFVRDTMREVMASPPVLFTEGCIISMHEALGMNSWASELFFATIAMRGFATLPLLSWRQNIIAKNVKIKEDLLLEQKDRIGKLEQHYMRGALSQTEFKQSVDKVMKELVAEKKVLLSQNRISRAFILIFAEIAIWMLLIVSVHNLCIGFPDEAASQASKQLQNTSFLWLKDLTLPDPNHILPLTTFVPLAFTTEYSAQLRKQNNVPNKFFFKFLTWAGRSLSFFILFVVWAMPSAMGICWTGSALLSSFQAIAINYPRVKKLLLLPPHAGYGNPVNFGSWKQDILHNLNKIREKIK